MDAIHFLQLEMVYKFWYQITASFIVSHSNEPKQHIFFFILLVPNIISVNLTLEFLVPLSFENRREGHQVHLSWPDQFS